MSARIQVPLIKSINKKAPIDQSSPVKGAVPQEAAAAPQDKPSYRNVELHTALDNVLWTHRGIIMHDVHGVMNYKNYWHKFIITGGCKYYKDFILKLIIESVSPSVLIPVKYEKEDSDTYFLARHCGAAMEKIARDGFVIRNPHGEDVRLRIILAIADCTYKNPIDVHELISAVVRKRYNPEEKTLNLKDFHNDPDLTAIFCPLSAPKILHIVFATVKQAIHAPLVSLSLANNDLSLVESLEPLNMLLRSNLRVLNLSYNKLDNINDLTVLSTIPLVELNLDNNPLCQRFDHETEYVKKIRELFPTIKILDGITLCDPNFPQSRRNFLTSPEAGPLVDQFLQHYYDLYDGVSRTKLKAVYHEQALFSMTATYVPGQSTSSGAQLTQYVRESRNLLRISDYGKADRLLRCGRQQVVKLLCSLAPTTHDPHTFTVDCTLYTGTTAHITVTGEFREASPQGHTVRSFGRSFVLTCVAPDEWQIANDTLNVFNACTEAAAEAFKVPRAPMGVQASPVVSAADKEQMVQIVTQITDMNSEYAVKCLEDSKWDIEEALTVFRDLFKLGRIPHEAFDVGY